MYLNEQKTVYKAVTKIVFSWSNVRTRCLLSFNRDWQRNIVTCLNKPKSLPGLRNWGSYSYWLRILQLTLAGLCAGERRPFLLLTNYWCIPLTKCIFLDATNTVTFTECTLWLELYMYLNLALL